MSCASNQLSVFVLMELKIILTIARSGMNRSPSTSTSRDDMLISHIRIDGDGCCSYYEAPT